MKCTIPEISWHNREPVLSVDISPISSDIYKLATGGGDSHVLIWQMTVSDNGAIKQEIVSDLTRHQKAVNAVRWSPSGENLASADDDANIIVWRQKTDNIPLLEGDTGDKEVWIVYKVLRGHKEDIYDICWSVNGLKIFSGSIDNTAIIWDFSKGKMEHILSEHKGFVQGVAWDPKNQVIVTISTDRTCRIFDISGRQIKVRLHRGCIPVPSSHYLFEKNVKYFHDDTFKSFYRRLQFSPDGSLLIVPSGHMETEDCKRTLNGTLIFSMSSSSTEPVAILPLPKQCSTVVRCCPVLFELRKDGPDPVIDLPYRIIMAIGTDHDIILYDTQQLTPFARFQEVHYTRLTDLTWSKDGLILIASSTDGFCSLITFDITELGIPYMQDDIEMEDCQMNISGCEELHDIDENIDISNKNNEIAIKETENTCTKKRSSFLEEWALKTPKKIRLDKETQSKDCDDVIEIIDDDNADTRELSKDIKDEIKKLMPSRTSHTITSGIKTGTDVRPIEVRRKPRQNNNETSVVEQNKVAKPYNKSASENTTQIGAITCQSTSLEKVCDKLSHSNSNTAEHNEDLTKKNKVNKNCVDLSVVIEDCELKKNKTINKKLFNSSTEKHKREVPKIKVTSLIKKKNSPKSIRKQNPLLNFLKNTTSEKYDAVNTSKGNSSVTDVVDLTLNEDVAQDAWKCEDDIKMCEIERNDEANVTQVEDCTEDFCLQLEDSQVEANIRHKCSDDEMENKTNTDRDTGNTVKVATMSNVSDKSNDSDKIKIINPQQQKVPRRVALITLSSPKGKKKEKS